MWVKCFENNFFITKLFNDMPQLENVHILSININPCNNNILIKINLSTFVDFPPPKWGSKGEYVLTIELDFYNVSINYFNKISTENVNIQIQKKENTNNFFSKDGIEMCFDFECGVIQSIKPNLVS